MHIEEGPIFASKMKKLKQIKNKKPKVDVLKPVAKEDKKLFNEYFDKKEKFSKNFLTGIYNWKYFE